MLHLRVGVPVVLLAAAAAQTPRRLRIVNGCDKVPIWIAHIATSTPGPDAQDVKIEPLAHFDFQTPDNLKATRYWPKVGCDALGGNCALGDSGGPAEGCVIRKEGQGDDYSHCAPPVDSKFEASFGINGQPCDPSVTGGAGLLGCDDVDVSFVDGFTLPIKLEIRGGECNSSSPAGGRVEEIDCSALTVDDCPRAEQVAGNRVVDLAAVNPHTHEVAGCYSPCMRLLDDKWVEHVGGGADDPNIAPYCCPTPPVGPEECRQGPIVSTQFVKTLKQTCPGAYSYAYDDSKGLLRCSSESHYVVTFFCLHAEKALEELVV